MIFRTLASAISARFGVSLDAAERMPARPWVAVFRDLPGYKNSPHPDGLEKIATVQIYTPPDGSRAHLGSRFMSSPAYPAVTDKQIPYIPNRGYGFVVTQDTWHWVKETTPDDGVRESIMLLYFREDAKCPSVGPTYWPEAIR